GAHFWCRRARRRTWPAATAPIRCLSFHSSIEAPCSKALYCFRLRVARTIEDRLTLAHRSRFAVPVAQIPEIVVPAAQMSLELLRDRRDARAVHDRNDIRLADHEIVHLDEEGRPFYRVELPFGGGIGLVVFLVPPASDVAALPFIVLGRDLCGQELPHELRPCLHPPPTHATLS